MINIELENRIEERYRILTSKGDVRWLRDFQKIAIEHHSKKLENPNAPNIYKVKIIHKSGKVKWIENNESR